MKDFFEKEEYSEADINQLINDSIEESLYLEFKAADALGTANGKKKEIAKDVSAFANSDGGILIYGISEDDHVANELSFIDGNEFTKEWLEQIINGNIQRKIEGIRVFPIRFDNEIEKTIYVVKIPASSLAPHMSSKEKRYYRRYNFEVLQMEEYEVRNLINRRQKTELTFQELKVIRAGQSSRSGSIYERYYNLECSIKNVSNSVEEFYKLQLAIPNNIISKHDEIKKYFNRTEDGLYYYSIPGTTPIFQNEIITMFKVRFEINSELMGIAENEFHLSLFYSNGSQKVDYSLLECMHDSGIDLSADFA